MRSRWRVSAAALLTGLALTGLAAVTSSLRTPPLLDGVFIEDPYRWVEPPPDGDGDPPSVTMAQPVVDGSVPLLAVATSEVPPQAQMIAQEDAFAIAADTASVTVSIQPSAPTDPTIAGNVYRFSVTDAEGKAMEIRPGAQVTLVLRAPQQDLIAQIARFDGASWVTIPTEFGGLPDLFAANITELGDFAVVVTGPTPSASAGSSAGSSAGASAGASSSPAPSASGGDVGPPIWLIGALGVVAVGAGLAWGLLGNRERR
jgi:hypothetical protein